jgi:hypothetical protein
MKILGYLHVLKVSQQKKLLELGLDGVFPYLYEGTTEEDYNLALSVEKSSCCVTFSEFFSSKHNKDDDKIEWMKQELAEIMIKQNPSPVNLLQMMWIMLLCKLHKNQNSCL